MAVKQKAIGVAWGIDDDGYTYTGAATVLNVKSESQSYRRMADKVDHLDAAGERIGATFFNTKETLSLRVYPSGATLAAAVTNNVLPSPGDKFVVTSSEDADIAGNYVVTECGKERKAGDKVFFDISLENGPNDISTDTAAL